MTKRRRRGPLACGVFVLFAGALVGTLAASCRQPTELVLEVRTNLRPDQVRDVAFVVGPTPEIVDQRFQASAWTAVTTDATADGFIGTLGVVPPSDDAALSVVVVLFLSGSAPTCTPPDYRGCIIARRRVSYLRHHALVVPIFMSDRCIGVPCDAVSTCASGNCLDSSITCNDDTCDSPRGEDPARPLPEIDGGSSDGGLIGDGPIVSKDASSSDTGSSGGLVGTLCNGTQCLQPSRCCYDPVTENQACVQSNVPCPPTAGGYSCDGPEDCPGAVCCLQSGGSSCTTTAACVSRLCHADADCPPKFCTESIGTLYQYCAK